MSFLDRTVLSSFALDDLDPADPVPPVWLVQTDLLARSTWPDLVRTACDRRIGALAVRWTALDGAGLAASRDARIRIGCFGCHDPAALTRVLEEAVDELSTDRPDLALDLRDKVGVRPSLR